MANFLSSLGAKVALGVTAVTGVGLATGVIPSAWMQKHIMPALEKQASFIVPDKDAAPVKTVPEIEQPVAEGFEKKPDEQKGGESAAKTDEPLVPKFDVLRVEEDGSVLVAGQAEGNAKVELFMSDGTVVGTTKAGPEGDFVILPDHPLKPGDYVLGLAATNENGTKVTSSETSVIKIPEPGGEVLAMVSPDGEVSRIIAKPKIAPSVVKTEVSDAKTETEEPVAKAPETKEADAKEADAKEAEIETAEPKAFEKVIVPNVAMPAATSQSVEETAPKVETKVATLDAATPEPEQTAKPKSTISPLVVVEAVEVENGQIFVAGAVKSGQLVRIYINNEAIGVARGTADDRFLLVKKYKLAEGQHSVRADVISATNGNVLARAEVPLIHEVQVAGLSGQKPDFKSVSTPEVDKPLKGDFAKVETPSVEKPLKKGFASVGTPKVEKPLKGDFAKVETPSVEKPLKEGFASVGTPKVEKPLKGDFSKVETPSVEKPLKEGFASVGTPKVEKPLKGDFAKVETPSVKLPQPLRTGRAIIIKPGDNLWRISRKTYGRGIRYTTIYNANRDQIRDPSRIYIGQIFKIPEVSFQ